MKNIISFGCLIWIRMWNAEKLRLILMIWINEVQTTWFTETVITPCWIRWFRRNGLHHDVWQVTNEHMSMVTLSWWRHQMETFSVLLAIWGTGEFPAQRPVTRSFDVFFDLRPNKRLSKQPWGWWFETLSCSLWCHCNDSLNSNHPP